MNPTESAALQLLLFLVIVGWRLGRKLRERPWSGDTRRWRLPLILTAVGAYETASLTSGAHRISFSAADLGYLVVVSGLSVLLGLVRGATIRLRNRDGVITQQYTAVTAVLWLATVAVRLVADAVAGPGLGVAHSVIGTSILMMFGLSLLGEAACVALRAGQLPHPATPLRRI